MDSLWVWIAERRFERRLRFGASCGSFKSRCDTNLSAIQTTVYSRQALYLINLSACFSYDQKSGCRLRYHRPCAAIRAADVPSAGRRLSPRGASQRFPVQIEQHLEILEGYCRFRPRGEASLVEAVALVTNAIAFCRDQKIPKLLVNVTGLTQLSHADTRRPLLDGGRVGARSERNSCCSDGGHARIHSPGEVRRKSCCGPWHESRHFYVGARGA